MNPVLVALAQIGVLNAQEAIQLDRLMDNDALRAWAEQQVAAVFAQGLQNQRGRLLRAIEEQGATLSDSSLAAFWRGEERELARDVLPTLTAVGQDVALASVVRTGGLDAWQAVNHAVIDWVEDYYIGGGPEAYGSIRALTDTARTQIGNLINAWQRGELEAATAEQGLPRLIAAMEDVFGAERGSMIAVTETTRIFAESTRLAAVENPAVTSLRWLTGRDELVCEVCGPLDNMVIDKGGMFPGDLMPPAHVNCRCSVALEAALTAGVEAGIGGAGTWNYALR